MFHAYKKRSTVTIELIIGGVIESSFFMSCQQHCGRYLSGVLKYCLYEYTRLTFGTLVFHSRVLYRTYIIDSVADFIISERELSYKFCYVAMSAFSLTQIIIQLYNIPRWIGAFFSPFFDFFPLIILLNYTDKLFILFRYHCTLYMKYITAD